MKDKLQIYCRDCEHEHSKYVRKTKNEMKKNIDKKLLNCLVTIEPAKHRTKTSMKPSKPSLSGFQSGELLRELKSRGYVWENLYVKQAVDYASI